MSSGHHVTWSPGDKKVAAHETGQLTANKHPVQRQPHTVTLLERKREISQCICVCVCVLQV